MTSCPGFKPIKPSRKDTLTLETKKQILAHNEFGLKRGCWK